MLKTNRKVLTATQGFGGSPSAASASGDLLRIDPYVDEDGEQSPKTWWLKLQSSQTDSAAVVTLTILETTGQAQFTRTMVLVPGPITSVEVYASTISVTAKMSNCFAGDQATVNVMASDAPGVDSLASLICSWLLDGNTGYGDTVQASAGAGHLLDVSGSVASMGNQTALWLFVCDAAQLSISGVALGVGGSGYTAVPTVFFAGLPGLGPITPASATASMGLGAVTVTVMGSGFTSAPTLTVDPPSTPGGVRATAVATVSGGAITGVTVTNPGSGYTTTPFVAYSGGGGSGASFSTTLTVVGLTLNSGGAGYVGNPTLNFSGGGGTGATGTATSTASAGTVQGIVPPVMITQAGQFGLFDEMRLKASYTLGLSWVLSTTQGGLTAAAGTGATARCDLAVGQ